MKQMLNETLVTPAGSGAADGTSAVKGTAVDTSGHETVVFVGAPIATANAGNKIKLQQSDTTTDGDFVDVPGSELVPATDGDLVAIEVYRPQMKYLRTYTTRGASTVANEMAALLCCGRTQPPNNNRANVIKSVVLISPEAS